MVMREFKDLNKLELHDMFADLMTYSFELESRDCGESTSRLTKALAAATIERSASKEKSAEQLSNGVMSLLVKKFDKFLSKNP